ncbi:hypothetical protein FB382_002670 [Nocardioides ginsengisegetis]|uniref:Uncharacterized protein n=1 Tax=Nocardioides ginsengisegetis TaxID=661491 RepID=A0A7W3J1D1_9ACTN|nr:MULTISPECIES: hypothetical protein [Nocardioides]MBA8804379.1 hypothetical protein [Nocardioides ginsengisegetis]GCD90940.1 hypothetical protein NLS1_29460 [Nocardioides sp. LS1]
MTTILVANLTLGLVVLVVGLLQKAHHHYLERPHASFGADLSRDTDLARVLHDLDARA